jgi:hypothetical protein
MNSLVTRQWSRVIIFQALEDRLALAETAGAWHDADHPDLQTPDDIDRWLTESFSAARWRDI